MLKHRADGTQIEPTNSQTTITLRMNDTMKQATELTLAHQTPWTRKRHANATFDIRRRFNEEFTATRDGKYLWNFQWQNLFHEKSYLVPTSSPYLTTPRELGCTKMRIKRPSPSLTTSILVLKHENFACSHEGLFVYPRMCA